MLGAPRAMNPEPLLVIVNPRAGGGTGRRRASLLVAELRRANLPFVEHTTAGANHATELARRAAGTVVVVGGDGTVHEVVNGLPPRGGTLGPLAVFAAGRGNDFAANAGFASDPRDFVHRLARAATRRIDVGIASVECEHGPLRRRFVNDAGLGFEAQVAAAAQRGWWLRGLPLYVAATLRALWRQRTVECDLEYSAPDAAVRENLPILFASTCNGPRVGGGLFFAPDARLDDRALDVVRVTARSRRATLALFMRLLRRRHLDDERVRLVRCATATMTPSEPLPLVMDGEVVAHRATRVATAIAPESLVVANGA